MEQAGRVKRNKSVHLFFDSLSGVVFYFSLSLVEPYENAIEWADADEFGFVDWVVGGMMKVLVLISFPFLSLRIPPFFSSSFLTTLNFELFSFVSFVGC